MTTVVSDVKIVNKAHIAIKLESQEEITAFKEMLNCADLDLRRRYVGGGDSLAKNIIDLLNDQLDKAGL